MKSNESRKSKRSSAGPRASRPGYSSVISLAASSANSLEAILSTIDSDVFRELKAIAGHIDTLRREMGKLQPGKLHRESIPAAGQELDAVVTATETASNRILENAEQVMGADASDPLRYKAFIEARMLAIFEACEFQDLTGQRIAKVIDTLKKIEARVARFAEVARTEEPSGSRRTRRGSRSAANSQAAVDKIFSTRKPRRKRR